VIIGNYQKAAATFSSWAARHFEDLNSEEQWDEALAASSQDSDMQVTQAMCTRKSILDGWGMMEPMRHTVPLGTTLAKLLECLAASLGTPRTALVTFVQSHTELCPGELLAVEPSLIALPDEAGAEFGETPVVIAQGAKAGTKVKSSQVAKIIC